MANQKDIQGLLKDRFKEFEAEPPRDLWPEIEAKIHPKRRAWLITWRYAAVAASVLLLISVWWLMFPSKPVQQDFIAQQNSPTEQTDEVQANAPVVEFEPNHQTSPVEKTEEKTISDQIVEAANQFIEAATTLGSSPNDEDDYASTPVRSIDPVRKRDFPKELTDVQDGQIAMNVPLAKVKKLEPEINAPKPASNMERVKHRRLDLNDVSFENILDIASNEISRWSKSPLEFEHLKGENEDYKKHKIELGSFGISRSTYRKTFNQ